MLRAAFAPRFAISCSRELLEAVASLSREHGVLIHTHASENRDEVDVDEVLAAGGVPAFAPVGDGRLADAEGGINRLQVAAGQPPGRPVVRCGGRRGGGL